MRMFGNGANGRRMRTYTRAYRCAWWLGLIGVLLAACGGEIAAVPTTTAPTVTVTTTMEAQAPTMMASVVMPATSGSPTSGMTVATTALATTATTATAATPTALSAAAMTAQPPATRTAASPVAATQAPMGNSLAQMHIGDGGGGYGFNVWGLNGSDEFRNRVYGNVQGAGFNWMRQQVIWEAMEPTKGNFGTDTTAFLDKFVEGAAAKKINVMLSVVKSPKWAGMNGGLPTRAQDFTDFMTFLTQRYKGRVQAYEIWNEQNYAYETGGKVNAAAYIPILRAGYQTVKRNDPAAVVVFGGLTPTGVDDPSIALNDEAYLRQIYALNGGEIKGLYDVMGVHPGSNCNPPDASYPAMPPINPCGTDPDGGRSYTKDNSFYFQRVQQIRKVMEDAGESGKKIWVTEFGWTTDNQAKGYEYGRYNTPEQQAQYLVRAIELGKSYPWMGVMFVWQLNFASITPESDEKHPWGVLDKADMPRPSYLALKNMPK